MKRNRFGINLDQGIPLLAQMDFDKLHVDCFSKTINQVLVWMEKRHNPLLLGGQIGSGKSTLIEKAILEASNEPDIVIHFDRDTLNLGPGDFWGITLAEFIGAALRHGTDLSVFKLPQEFGYEQGQWNALYSGLHPTEVSMNSFATKSGLRKTIADNAEYVAYVIGQIGRLLQGSLGRALFVFASGLDKFGPTSSAHFTMHEVVSALSEFKTLYEVNAVDLVAKRLNPSLHSIDQIFIPAAEPDAVVEMLSKRMGAYAKAILKELPVLAEWSGGNPRQAIRLLTHFETAKKNRKSNHAEAIAVAIHETAIDYFAFSPKPSDELINTIRRSGTINPSLLSLPGDRDTARMAVYGNWILIKEILGDGSWAMKINPLIKGSFVSISLPEEPEARLLKKYAEGASISTTGLGIDRIEAATGKEKGGDQLLWHILGSGIEQPIHSNLCEAFDILSGALLSKDRADRIIVAYKDQNVIEAARSYLFAKANTFEYQRYLHFDFEGGPGKQPLEQLEKILSNDTDIISLQFSGEWKTEQLDALDTQRDRFLDNQMLWWIPSAMLSRYLAHWVQLRQLFEILVLEDELLRSISTEEVEADLDFFEELVENRDSAEANVVTELKKVLEYLKRVRGGQTHG